jgi:PPOX class probable F420-dependent enzyme
MTFQPFAGQKYLSLETFKKSGPGVRTPIWFAADPAKNLASGDAKLFVYTNADTGKVKRIRNNGRVRIAPCDMRGNISGEWVEARAEIVTGIDFGYAMQLLNKKYFPLKQLLDFFAMFRPREHVVIAILHARA